MMEGIVAVTVAAAAALPLPGDIVEHTPEGMSTPVRVIVHCIAPGPADDAMVWGVDASDHRRVWRLSAGQVTLVQAGGTEMTRTGWPPGLMQDDSRELSRWFASCLDARRVARQVAAEIAAARKEQK